MDSISRRNDVLSARIAEWATGRSTDFELETTIPSKRKADEIADKWNLRMCYGLDNWSAEVAPSSPISLLTDLAFRYLNAKMPTSMTHIKLFHGSRRISFDSTILTSTGIKDGDLLRVETSPEPPQTIPCYGSDSMCLIKLYRGRQDKARACFWVPRDTDARVLSLLIRYWHWSESDLIAQAVTPSQLEVWTPNNESEDFLEEYWAVDTSDSLRDIFQDYACEGWLENEPMFEKPRSIHSIHISQTLPDYRPHHQSTTYIETIAS
jgi:hypothetical protein